MNVITEITYDDITYDLSEHKDALTVEGSPDPIAVQCPECREWFAFDEWSGNCYYGNLSEQSLCLGCYEADMNYPSTVLRIDAEGTQTVSFGDHTGYGMVEDYTDEPFDWFFDLYDQWSGRAYHHTDGWRGYYCTERNFTGITVLDDGWVTGDWDDVPWKRDIHHFLKALQDKDIVPPAPLYALFEPTSNVFSTATTLFCRNEDADTLKVWLHDGQPYDVHGALS